MDCRLFLQGHFFGISAWFVFLSSLLVAQEPNPAPFGLVRDGRGVATLVIPDEPKPVEQLAAEEFQHHIRKASGVELPIIGESGSSKVSGPKVYFGATKQLTESGHSLFPQPTRHSRNPDDYQWKGHLSGDRLFFWGVDGDGPVTRSSTPAGTLFAVYDFLESELGAHWIWPGETGEIVEPKQTIELSSYSQTGRPHFVSTRWWRFKGIGAGDAAYVAAKSGWKTLQARDDFLEAEDLWFLRQRFRNLAPVDAVLHDFEKGFWTDYKDVYPDIFARLPNGSRKPYDSNDTTGKRVSMCVSNGKLPELFVERWKARWDGVKEPWADPNVISVGDSDIPMYCSCEDCRSWDAPDESFANHAYWSGKTTPTSVRDMWSLLGGPESPPVSDRYAKLLLKVQEEAHRQGMPDARIAGLAYVNYANPPKETRLNENIWIYDVSWPSRWWTKEGDERTRRIWDGWRSAGAQMVLRPNSPHIGHNMPAFYARRMGKTFAHAANNGMIATNIDSALGQWPTQGPNYYVLARLHQDPNRDPGEILDEYYAAFGPAKDAVKAYFDHWESFSDSVTNEEVTRLWQEMNEQPVPKRSQIRFSGELFSRPGVMEEGRRLMEKAKVAAQTDAEAKARIEVLDLGLKNAELTLAAYLALKKYVRDESPENHHRLANVVKRLMAFRYENERRLVTNLGWLTTREAHLWDHKRLASVKSPVPSAPAEKKGAPDDGMVIE